MIKTCQCGINTYDSQKHSSCYQCFVDRSDHYLVCIYCTRWHSPGYAMCYTCRKDHPGRDDAAKDLRVDILMRDGYACQKCGSIELLQVDHIKPCYEDGTADPWNLHVLCRSCNIQKGKTWNTYWMEYRIKLMRLYLTFGWALLETGEQIELKNQSSKHIELVNYSHANDERREPPQWAIEMADKVSS